MTKTVKGEFQGEETTEKTDWKWEKLGSKTKSFIWFKRAKMESEIENLGRVFWKTVNYWRFTLKVRCPPQHMKEKKKKSK